MLSPKRLFRAVFDRIENVFDAVFTPAWNPFYQLGALGWYFFWIVTVSGIYVYIFFDTGVTQAYESLEAITHTQWYAGGVMRSLHRYASDALVVVIFIHLLREYAMDRLRGRRWFAWVTGVPLIWFVYVCGISGYWLVWDTLAQYVAIATSEWLDSLPLFGQPIASNFASADRLSGRFFTLLVYIHIAIPLFTLFLMWVHIKRYARARTNPHTGLAVGTLLSLVVLSLWYPAVSQAPADLGTVPASIGLDWFYLMLYPLLDVVPGGQLWLAVTGGTAVLLALPWAPPAKKRPAAVVDLDNCNGCGRCNEDCPFSAITIVPRTDGAPFKTQAAVDPDGCLSCGLCVGSCPTATPFRRMTALVPGIELPDYKIATLRDRLLEESAKLAGDARVLAFACEHSCDRGALTASGAGVLVMPCVGMLPPSFIDFVLSRRYADGVFLAGCRDGDCYFRLGADWTRQRLARQRDPYLRERVPQERVHLSWTGGHESRRGARALAGFQQRLSGMQPPTGSASAPERAATQAGTTTPRPARLAAQAFAYLAFLAFVGYLSASPRYQHIEPDSAMVKLVIRHTTARIEECRRLTQEEIAARAPNMRTALDCPRERHPIFVELTLDGDLLYSGMDRPTGLWKDGPANVYEKFTVPAGRHDLEIRLRDSGRTMGFDYEHRQQADLRPQQNLVVDFDARTGFRFLNE